MSVGVDDLITESFAAMNTTIDLGIEPRGDRAQAAARLTLVRRFLVQAEHRLSRFLADSELSAINRAPGGDLPVSPLVWQLLQMGLEAREATEGLFDPLILAAVEGAGYDRSFEHLGSKDGVAVGVLEPRPGRRRLLGPDDGSVVLPAGARIDFGGIAKGWLADRAAAALDQMGSCFVNVGGDIRTRGAVPWPVGIQNPLAPEQDLQVLWTRDRGVATSAVWRRQWRSPEGWRHHLIDPRTGSPAVTDLLAVSVVAPTAAWAEVHAKAAIMLGAREGLAYIEARPELAALLVRDEGTVIASRCLSEYA